MNDRIRCAACNVVVPFAKTASTKWALGTLAGLLGGGTTKRLGWGVLSALVGFGIGHLIDEAAAPFCGSCGSALPA